MEEPLTTFLYYIRERENIRLRKEVQNQPWPWTEDKILQMYSFTNVKRAHDRTTRAFVRFYSEHYNPALRGRGDRELLYNCGIARYFGTVEFQQAVGWCRSRAPSKLIRTAQKLSERGEQVFTGAYMVTNAGREGPKEEIVAEFLEGLWEASEDIIRRLTVTRTWEAAYHCLCMEDGFGGSGFMAKEVLQDFLLVTGLPVDDAETWTPMGPGARRGINRLRGRPKDFSQVEEKFIAEVQELHIGVRTWWRNTFPQAGSLTAHDVQFCLCEYDKYMRVKNNEGRPRSLYRPPGEVRP